MVESLCSTPATRVGDRQHVPARLSSRELMAIVWLSWQFCGSVGPTTLKSIPREKLRAPELLPSPTLSSCASHQWKRHPEVSQSFASHAPMLVDHPR
eukprot:6472182-Amphidinium_carterae.1